MFFPVGSISPSCTVHCPQNLMLWSGYTLAHQVELLTKSEQPTASSPSKLLIKRDCKTDYLKVSACRFTQLCSVHMALTSIRWPCWAPCLRVLIPCSLRPWSVKRDHVASWSRAQVIGTNTNMWKQPRRRG